LGVDRRSTLVTSQFPVEHWYEALGDPTLADAILDRLVHNAHRLVLQGESLRKHRAARGNPPAGGNPPVNPAPPGEASRDASGRRKE
jgi:hypothetical protein